MYVDYVGNRGIVSNETTGFTYQTTSNPRELDQSLDAEKANLPIANNYYKVGDWRILPYGERDNLPNIIKQAVQENSSAPGMIEKKVMMYYGNGPVLYKETYKDNQIVRELVADTEILAWFKTWDVAKYLLKCAVDYEYMKGNYTKLYRNRAARIGGQSKIAKLEHVTINEARLACPSDSISLEPTHIVVISYSNGQTQINPYPIIDKQEPFKYPVTMHYSNQYTFGDKHYSTPPLYGAIEWLRRSTATPLIFKALSKNSINVKYHVESPEAFWELQEERLKENAEKAGREYNNNEIVEFRINFLRDLVNVLAGYENSGKLWHTRKIIEVQGNNILEHGWSIKEIPQNVKDFVEAQIKINERADRVLSVNQGMNQGISNTGEAGKVNGGSEQVYAYQNFINSSVEVPEMVICASLNMAIEINWPEKNIRVGFNRNHAQTLSNINPADRPINQKTK